MVVLRCTNVLLNEILQPEKLGKVKSVSSSSNQGYQSEARVCEVDFDLVDWLPRMSTLMLSFLEIIDLKQYLAK